MPDTERTLAALLTLLADNSIGAISEQDLRDVVVSAFGGYGSIYVKAGVTAQTVSGTPSKMTGFAANGVASSSVTPDHTDDSVTVDLDGVYDIDLLMGSFTGTNGSTITLDIRIDGVTSGLPTISRTFGTPATAGSAATGGQLSLTAGQVITVYVSSTDTSYTPQNAVLKVRRVG